jgi:hypothetical protein
MSVVGLPRCKENKRTGFLSIDHRPGAGPISVGIYYKGGKQVT